MLAKITVKNQITLPKAVLAQVAPAEYYEVAAEGGRIVLTPVQVHSADAVRLKLEALGIAEQDIEDALRWARSPDDGQAKAA
ncbi:MAG: AbrB/MazE/SpoVT family DNA-binding domain-containing protein [Serpentinimonas sp.]|nr:AbrB/MazE/SpoVT family DNA-binding domain-containing protein [Serpentinimonas sp.]